MRLIPYARKSFQAIRYPQQWARTMHGSNFNNMGEIRQLLDLINGAVDTLETTCAANGTKIPSLYEPFHPGSEAFREDPTAARATMIISTAALQLAAVVLPPSIPLFNVIGGQWNSAALRTCLEASVTEILSEAGPEGCHVDEISSKTGLDANKLGRCLRLLTIHHLYREVKPDVFSNTRISSMLDTLKPSKDVISDPELKHDNTTGFTAFAGHHLDEIFKSSAYLWETMSHPKIGKSEKPGDAPLSKALSNGKGFFDYLAQPDQKFRQKRFNIGMRAGHAMLSTATVLQAYDWKSLPQNAVVVDVGGGIGTASLALAHEHRNMRIVVQDQPAVVEAGIKHWENELPDALISGRVMFEAHDFFTPQPRKKASVYFLKYIIHDWSDEYSTKILKQLRHAADPSTKLICLEAILPYGCHIVNTKGAIPGSGPIEAPEPLLAHWGVNSAMTFYLDMVMMVGFNSLERTIGQFQRLFRGAGWGITVVRRPIGKDALGVAAIEAIPI